MKPRLTVGITCQKEGSLLQEAIDSIRNQTFQDFECIVYNDGSIDSTTLEICRSISDPRFKVILGGTIEGPATARNNAVLAASTNIYVPLDGDDILPPKALGAISQAFEDNPDVGFIYGNLHVRGDWFYDHVPGSFKRCDILLGMPFAGMSPFQIQTWVAVGGFDPALSIGRQDWEFWISVISRGISGIYIDDYIYVYRARSGTVARRCDQHYDYIVEYIYKKHKYFVDKCRSRRSLLKLGYRRAANSSYVSGEQVIARRQALKALISGSITKEMFKILLLSYFSPGTRSSIRSWLSGIGINI